MADRKPTVIDPQSGPLFQHVAVMLDGPPDIFPRYLLSRELDTRFLALVIRGESDQDVDMKVRYGCRQRKLDGTIEFVRFNEVDFNGLKRADLHSTTNAIVLVIEFDRKPVDWIEMAAWCNSPLEGNYISVKASAMVN
jgi:hypothetical protein